MSTNLRINTGVDDIEIEHLLAQQAQIQARLTSLLPASAPSTSYTQHRSPIYKQHSQHAQRRSGSSVPRSMSSNGMTRQLSSDRIEAPSRSRNFSQRSAPPMARTSSKGSTSQRTGNLPFTQTGAMPPPLQTESRRENPAMTAWATQEQPLSSYTFSHQSTQLQRSTSQQKSELGRVPEHGGVFEDPSEFISRTFGSTPILSISPSMPVSTSTPYNSNNHQHRLSTGSLNYAAPSTPTTDTLTTGTTLTSNPMSRQNSLFNEPLLEGIQMMKFNSNASYSDVNVDHTMYDPVAPTTFISSRHARRSSNEEQSQLLVGAGASHDSHISHSLSSPYTSSGSFGEKMEKSQSNESTSSLSSSSSSRSKLRLKAQIAQARPLMPKGGSDGSVMCRDGSSQSMARIESRDGSHDKVAISKPTYQRPKHDRVYCKLCEVKPEGFRGEHELRRHQDREHKTRVKKWVCVEPSANDGVAHEKPMLPLFKCKACGPQRKKYGAYYNAAAHLRRAHFKPKASKSRTNKSEKMEKEEKRGGKGGGDWPPMSELKYWMKEVEEVVTEYSLTGSQQDDEAAASDDEIDSTIDEQHYAQRTIATLGSNSFDSPTITDYSPSFVYPTVNDVYGMQMSLDTPSQCMDQSMFNGSVEGNFSNFSPFQNDPLAFFDTSLTQNFDDQTILAGPDFDSFPTY